ncbi:1841_t:CDS:2, partial [Cetraspora pellucida]
DNYQLNSENKDLMNDSENEDLMNNSENKDLINDSSGSRDNDETERKKITIKKAINFIAESWDNPVEDDFLLENDEIEEIVAKLPDESSYVSETAHATITYLQLIDEPAATEEIFNDKEIISMVQADENEESVK